ncbi:hypothetical protein EST38_g4279 [Candolleomyces aberdarensis]|uniref:Uncharacterized protein n=1 Tax=Candolleomyces aberdarensis TaxID=2316362 RepID=A0A4Q2DRP8_9AGAR|nr:hypothetical protein EST38_g4279 [Candolleomyces aberdarensis]
MNGTFRYMIKCTPVERSSTQHRIPAESDDSGMPSGFTAMLLIGSKPVASVVIPPVTMGFLQPYAPPDGRLPLRATVIVDALEIALRVKKTITLGIAVVTSAHREHCPRLRKGDWIFQASRSAGGAPATCESSEVVKTFYEESVSVLPSWVTLQHIISNEN